MALMSLEKIANKAELKVFKYNLLKDRSIPLRMPVPKDYPFNDGKYYDVETDSEITVQDSAFVDPSIETDQETSVQTSDDDTVTEEVVTVPQAESAPSEDNASTPISTQTSPFTLYQKVIRNLTAGITPPLLRTHIAESQPSTDTPLVESILFRDSSQTPTSSQTNSSQQVSGFESLVEPLDWVAEEVIVPHSIASSSQTEAKLTPETEEPMDLTHDGYHSNEDTDLMTDDSPSSDSSDE